MIVSFLLICDNDAFLSIHHLFMNKIYLQMSKKYDFLYIFWKFNHRNSKIIICI